MLSVLVIYQGSQDSPFLLCCGIDHKIKSIPEVSFSSLLRRPNNPETRELKAVGCSSRGCPPRMQQQRLSSQDAAAEAVLPGCSSRASQQRALSCEEEGLVCFLLLIW
ncbi:hypothetical protein CgunFtcFv8_004933 [Champsocephalus gunnari]|uniref:Uncharacterized protein n=1 Tax=Champsocephalus gunnari TaxID=52237 RepID=A0AAN8CWF9_CHAGU|nr:hypothetical protein CgunFtcFv8_004933 [Champsocephalus gunnari]